jgi:DNA ligase-associated metallophosphoesterase
MIPPAGAVEVSVAGEALWLLPQRAAYWPGRRMLLVADAHLGKAAAFRAQGIAVPRGTTFETLERLSAAVGATGARCVAFLGDLLHSRRGRAPRTLDAFTGWRHRHAGLELVLVRGNHDRHAGDPPADWEVRCVADPWSNAPFALRHAPQAADGCYVIAGHLHPVIRLGGRGGERLRLPCFLLGRHWGVLPAFGAFTGGFDILPKSGEKAFALAGDRVVPIPARPQLV